MSFYTPDAVWTVEFKDAPRLYGRAPWMLHRMTDVSDLSRWDCYLSNGYLPGHLPSRALTTLKWTHRVISSYVDLLNVIRPIHRGRGVPIASSDLLRDAPARPSVINLGLLSYGALNTLALALDLWLFRTVDELRL